MSAVIAHAAAGGSTTVQSLQYVERSSSQEETREPVGKPLNINWRDIMGSSMQTSLEASARRANWYKYAAVVVLGAVGLAAFIAGFVLGYSWVLIAVGGIAILTSLYAAKQIENGVKHEGLAYERRGDELASFPRNQSVYSHLAIGTGNSLFDIRSLSKVRGLPEDF